MTNFRSRINFPVDPTPTQIVSFLTTAAATYDYTAVRPEILAALANQLDRMGRGLDAAEVRSHAGQLSVKYFWRHRPTGWISYRLFDSRHAAWMYLSRHSTTTRLRSKVQSGTLPADKAVRLGWGEFTSGNGRRRGYIGGVHALPSAYVGEEGHPIFLVSDLELVVRVSSGYSAAVADQIGVGVTFRDYQTPQRYVNISKSV